MPRTPSYKQEFIKHYAKLIYGSKAKSNALSKTDRAKIKYLFDCWVVDSLEEKREVHHYLLLYIIWLKDNWKAVLDRQKTHRGNLKADLDKPTSYLISPHMSQWHLDYVLEGKKLYS